jgi:hypothetical protein
MKAITTKKAAIISIEHSNGDEDYYVHFYDPDTGDCMCCIIVNEIESKHLCDSIGIEETLLIF